MQVRRGHGDIAVGEKRYRVARVEPDPLVGVGTGYPASREFGERGGRTRLVSIGTRIGDENTPESADHLTDRGIDRLGNEHLPARIRGGHGFGGIVVARLFARNHSEQSARGFVFGLNRRDKEASAGTRHRDQKESQFIEHEFLAVVDLVRIDSREGNRQSIRFEKGAAGSCVGPHTVVHPGDDHDVELTSDCRGGSTDKNRTRRGAR